jgi:hypothetical protein
MKVKQHCLRLSRATTHITRGGEPPAVDPALGDPPSATAPIAAGALKLPGACLSSPSAACLPLPLSCKPFPAAPAAAAADGPISDSKLLKDPPAGVRPFAAAADVALCAVGRDPAGGGLLPSASCLLMLLLLAAAASRQPVKGHSRQLLAALCSKQNNKYGYRQACNSWASAAHNRKCGIPTPDVRLYHRTSQTASITARCVLQQR